jgi:hypothetical protein
MITEGMELFLRKTHAFISYRSSHKTSMTIVPLVFSLRQEQGGCPFIDRSEALLQFPLEARGCQSYPWKCLKSGVTMTEKNVPPIHCNACKVDKAYN